MTRLPWCLSALTALAVLAAGGPGARAEATDTDRAQEAAERGGPSQARRGSKKRAARPHREQARRAASRPKKKASRSKKKSGEERRPQGLHTPWHAPPDDTTCPALQFAVDGSWGLVPVDTRECNVLPPLHDEQSEAAAQLVARDAFHDKRSGVTHDVHPRLLRILYRGVQEFQVPYVHLVSGYREGRSASRHSHGLAADVVFPGVHNKRLAAFMRGQGFMGVGIYVRSGFVHLDVRERSYFWLDWSPPGQRWRGKPVGVKEARAADAAAVERGERPFDAPDEMSQALARTKARRAKARERAAERERERERARRAAKKRAAQKRARERREAEEARKVAQRAAPQQSSEPQ